MTYCRVVGAGCHYRPVGVFHLASTPVVSQVLGGFHRMKTVFVSVLDLDWLQILLNLIILCPQSAFTAKGPWSVWWMLVIPGQMLAQNHIWATHQKLCFRMNHMKWPNSFFFLKKVKHAYLKKFCFKMKYSMSKNSIFDININDVVNWHNLRTWIFFKSNQKLSSYSSIPYMILKRV